MTDLNLIALLDMVVTVVIGRSDENIEMQKSLQRIIYELQREGATKETITEFKEVWEKLEAAQSLLIREIKQKCTEQGFYYDNLKSYKNETNDL